MRQNSKLPRPVLLGTIAGALAAALIAAVVFLSFFALVICLFCLAA